MWSDVAGRASMSAMAPLLGEIAEDSTRDRVSDILARCVDKSHWTDLAAMPVTPDIPASRFDAVQHIRAVAAMMVAIGDCMSSTLGIDVDRDELLAAAILHDASKWLEFAPSDSPDVEEVLSDEGSALPHAAYVAVLALEAGLPTRVVDAIASHSPQSTRPTTSHLSVILHHIDLMITDCCRLSVGLPSVFKIVRY
jgi:HD domain